MVTPKNKMKLNFIKLVEKVQGFYISPPSQQFELKAATHSKIPDVTYRYNEYQEPLVGDRVKKYIILIWSTNFNFIYAERYALCIRTIIYSLQVFT